MPSGSSTGASVEEHCSANHPYQCEGENLLPAPGHDEDGQAQILLLHAEQWGHWRKRYLKGLRFYENPNAQVFLRRIPPKIITDEERQVVEDGMRTYAEVQDYKIDVKGNAIVVYTADQDIETLAGLFKDMSPDPTTNPQLMTLLRNEIHYSPMLQFLLEDAQRRLFTAQRYCFVGSIDDWIAIGHGSLSTLVKRYVKHLGQESYFDLY